ncbi:MAG: pknB [Mycobacterium sp.]|nr:pknB [Mycobacterium sp.]
MTTPRRLSGRYELGDILGLGGMSEVHLARDLRLHRDVAVKVLRADMARDSSLNLRFRREARNAAGLNHPAIAAVYDTGEVETQDGVLPYIVMEYVDGLSLRDVLRIHGPLEAQRAIEVVADVCQALSFSHRRGIIHRDVKPANIMIDKSGSVKVVDFGIAKAMLDDEQSVTQSGAVIGTAQYLSPEQARGDPVDARADVYSLGCVLYELLTGEPPFAGDSAVEVAYKHMRETPVPPSGRNATVTADADAVALKAMAKDPDDRYQSAAEMRTDLVRLHSGSPSYAASAEADTDAAIAWTPPTVPLVPNKSRTARMPTQGSARGQDREPRGSVGRWLAGVAVLAVAAVVVTIGINAVGPDAQDATVPTTPDAPSSPINAVGPDAQDATVPTTPDAPSSPRTEAPLVTANDQQAVVPDVSSMTYAEAVMALTNAGFRNFQQSSLPSTPDLEDRVVGTNPPANRSTAITTKITIVLGSGSPLDGP